MNILFIVALIAVSLNCYTAAKNLPSYIKKCKKIDPVERSKCMMQRIEELKPYLIKGIPEMKLLPIEPLRISQIQLSTVNGFNAECTDIFVYGVKDVQIKELNFDLENKRTVLDFYIPTLQLEAKYNLEGKILLFQLKSSGNAHLNCSGVKSRSEGNLAIVTRNGKEYIDLDKSHDGGYSVEHVSIYFENVFADNPQLTEQTNAAINENIGEIQKELSPLIFESLDLFVTGLIQNVFNEFSIDELYD